ncbi:lysine N(6)-hydroxylase/L-ornithine N(5)-oxygenase family protein [Streptomyces sp. NBC_00654]|uniref:lysine N(6)-hydroxylase/L-ornithine N(5)-oxygenase family protein n=1 Tax=Streptomyces sp. NBC_00654 TaxID=2975799 RepID=UPI002258B974|nr:SidA/IucD/PvdA family monooxygenase [Streptomyces sp. NBC_00654]MCX4970966.1 SidA/IucD/PvdA family monooxygenase [Streptomyces sp. NBC_00654]
MGKSVAKSSTRTAESESTHYQCLGIGVGPANLSLASLLHGRSGVPNLFLDEKEQFGWHDGQQLPGATLQVSMLKDLVLLSDPTNGFSFLSYLHEQGKIYHFINAQYDAVPRMEFRNYLEWASRRNRNVVFGEKVLGVEFDGSFVVHTSRRTLKADNVVVGVGTLPWVPEPSRSKLGETQLHVSDFTAETQNLAGKRIAVIGGGQSGAEAFLNLIARPPKELPRRVTWISRRENYLPIDDSPFTNEYYVPSYSDYFFGLDREARQSLNKKNVLTSDGISESTLREIYQRCYEHRFIHRNEDLVALLPNRGVTDVTGDESGGWTIEMDHNDKPDTAENVDVDVIVWATGFRPAPTDFLEPLAGRLEHEGDEYRIDQDFAVQWDGPQDRRIFMQNASRGQRGLADPNLSLTAWRSRRIFDRIVGVGSDEQLPSFVEWSAKPRVDELGGL